MINPLPKLSFILELVLVADKTLPMVFTTLELPRVADLLLWIDDASWSLEIVVLEVAGVGELWVGQWAGCLLAALELAKVLETVLCLLALSVG